MGNKLIHPKLTQKRLKDVLHYDPDTGLFVWKKRTARKICVGDIAGWIDRQGYLRTRIDNRLYANHRLAFLYIEGYFPENDVDHINRIKDDNRWCNLREVSRSCNSKNIGNSCRNTSGVKGVHFDKSRKKWSAAIFVAGKHVLVGRYSEKSEAVCVRLAVEQCLNWDGCNCNSPAYKYVQKMLKINKKNK